MNYSATYSPEDNKLRLYIGRVPREEYEKLRAEGWTALHKQREAGGGDFVATWTPERRDTALEYAGIIEDEDMGPEERAADRAERFGMYRDKRTSEAVGHADRFDAGPQAHGYQSQERAERAAARHDKIAGRACDAWSKAEYWQRRTAGVISHALYKSSPGVRMGRIKEIEADIRRIEKSRAEYAATYERWQKCAAITEPETLRRCALQLAYVEHGDYIHPRTGRKSYLYDLARTDAEHNPDPLTGEEVCALWLSKHKPLGPEGDWLTHYRMRLAYENQMLEAQGGRAAFVEMEVGGWIGGYQIRKVNKSNATGRVVSVNVMDPKGFSGFTRESGYKEHVTRPAIVTLNIERLSVESYRPPTPEDVAKLAAEIKEEKAKAPKKESCPLINPADEDAEKLVSMWNEERRVKHEERNIYTSESARKSHSDLFKPCIIQRVTQAVYSANSKGSYARAETKKLCSLGRLEERQGFCDYKGQAKRAAERGPALCQIRVTGFDPVHVIILTDKPQKPLPKEVWQAYTPKTEAVAETVNA